jgi:hypothetical protein
VLDKEKADALGIKRIPAIAVLGQEKDYGIRLYGVPSGYEFGTLIDAILDVSQGQSVLSDETKQALGRARQERPRPGVLDAHLTLLPPGGPPGLPVRDRERQDHRRRRRSHRLSRAGAEVQTSPASQDGRR